MKVLEKLRSLRVRKRPTAEEYLQKMLDRGIDEHGREMLDSTPMAPPIGYKKQPSMVEIVRDMVQSEKLAMAAQEAGMETFEESEDFDIPDDPLIPRSEWENEHDPTIAELLEAGREAIEERKQKTQSPPAERKHGEPGESVDPPTDGPVDETT